MHEPDERTMTIIEHLEEMRIRIIKCLVLVAVLFPACFYSSLPMISWFKQNFCQELPRLHGMEIQALFFCQLKVALFASVVLAIPFIAYHIWQFVSPALFPQERRFVVLAAVISSFLFVVGAVFALFVIFPMVVEFMVGPYKQSDDFVLTPTIQNVVGVASMLMIGFGIMFQLPIVVFALVSTGIVSTATMKHGRPYVIIVILIVSALLTPPDIYSQLLMAIPTLFLFECSLFFAGIAERKNAKASALAEDEGGDDT